MALSTRSWVCPDRGSIHGRGKHPGRLGAEHRPMDARGSLSGLRCDGRFERASLLEYAARNEGTLVCFPESLNDRIRRRRRVKTRDVVEDAKDAFPE